MSDIESTDWSEIAANNIQPSPAGWPPNSSPNIVYTTDREMMGALKRDFDRRNPTVTSGGTGNAQTISYTVNPTAYVLGQRFCFFAGATNTGPATLNVGGLGAKAVQMAQQPLKGGEMTIGQIVEVVYDSVQFQITWPGACMPLTGGNMNGYIVVTTPAGQDANLYLNKNASGRADQLIGQTNGSTRWAVIPGNATAETGSPINTGSDFAIARYDDTGAVIDTPFIITRTTGNFAFNHDVSINSNFLHIATTTPNFRVLTWDTGTIARWQMFANNTAEGGGNAGSDFAFQAMSDTGVAAGVFSVVRSTQIVSFVKTIVNGPSDRSLKENIAPLDGALDKVKALQGVSFNMKATPDKREIGLIAQDVEPVIPEIIQQFTMTDSEGKQDNKLALDYPKLTALLIEAVKTLTARIDKLEARLPLAPETA